MIKIARILLLLMFCLGLIIVTNLTASPRIVTANPNIDIGQVFPESKPVFQKPEPALQESEPALQESEPALQELKQTLQELKQTIQELNKENQEIKQIIKIQDSKIDDSSHFGFIIAIALNFLLTILCFIILKNNIDRNAKATSRRFENLKDKTSKDENDLYTINNDKIASTELENFKKRISTLEDTVRKLLQEVSELKFTLKNLQSGASDRGYQRLQSAEIPKTLNRNEEPSDTLNEKFSQKSSVGILPSQNNAINRDTTVLRDDTLGTTFKQTLNSQGISKINEIVSAFNEMMSEVTKAKGLDSKTIRESFAEKYRVVTFKCINSEDRVNHPELPPTFESSKLVDSKLWGIPLTSDTLAVLPSPSLRDYESSTHYQGGMKELFKSNYISGNYRKIELIEPAIMTSDFQIIKQKGELRLSQQ